MSIYYVQKYKTKNKIITKVMLDLKLSDFEKKFVAVAVLICNRESECACKTGEKLHK